MEESTVNESRQAKNTDTSGELAPQTTSSLIHNSRTSSAFDEKFETMALASLTVVERLRWEEKQKYKKARHYPFPFVADEAFIRKLDRRAAEWLVKAGAPPNHPPTVVAEVRFPDLSSSRFTTVEELLEKAGDQHDPERLVIEWSAVLQQPLVSTARIAVVFTTEKPLQVRELQWFEYPVASIDLIVEGAEQRWVDNTFTELDPFFPSVRLGGMYRPLWVFRNKAVVHLSSWVTGFIAQMIYNGLIQVLQRPGVNTLRQNRIDKIISQPTAEAKIDMFVRELYGPFKDNPLFEGVIQLAGGMLTMLIVVILGYMLYPKLVPRAGINIGLTSTRYAVYENTFRLVIFTIMVSGILLPLLRTLLF
jgi:hypothetical protein